MIPNSNLTDVRSVLSLKSRDTPVEALYSRGGTFEPNRVSTPAPVPWEIDEVDGGRRSKVARDSIPMPSELFSERLPSVFQD